MQQAKRAAFPEEDRVASRARTGRDDGFVANLVVADPHLTAVGLNLVVAPERWRLSQPDSSDDLDAVRMTGNDAAGDDVDLGAMQPRQVRSPLLARPTPSGLSRNATAPDTRTAHGTETRSGASPIRGWDLGDPRLRGVDRDPTRAGGNQ